MPFFKTPEGGFYTTEGGKVGVPTIEERIKLKEGSLTFDVKSLADIEKTIVSTEKQLPEEFATKALETVKSIQAGISEVQAGIKTLKPVEEVPPIVPSEDLDIGVGGAPVIPEGDSNINLTAYTTGLQADLANKQKALQEAYDQQVKDLREQQTALETKIADFTAKQEKVIEEGVKPLLDPFREDLEKTERVRLKVEENFFANQKTLGELETLLTQATAEIQSMQEVTGLSSIRNPRIAQFKEDMAARVGVLEATMAARNDQIDMANTLIDRSVSAIEADRQDQLTYYNTILNFYDKQRDEAGEKLITLTTREKKFIDKQISQLESEQRTSQEAINMIKNAMTDPATANIYEQAGIKLTDSVAEINAKLAAQARKQNVIDIRNTMEEDGFKFLATPELIAVKEKEEGIDIVRQLDSQGNELVFWKKAEAPEGTSADWVAARQFIIDNPTSSLTELEQEIKNRTNLSDEDIKDLLEDREDITEEGKVLSRSQILSAAQAMKQDDVGNYFRARFTTEELKEFARAEGFTKGGGFLGFGIGEQGIEDYLESPAARAKLAELLEQQYIDSGFTITETEEEPTE